MLGISSLYILTTDWLLTSILWRSFHRMSLQDFKTHFVDLMICKLTPDLMSQEDGKKWMYSLQIGRWVKGSTAGGRMRPYKGERYLGAL